MSENAKKDKRKQTVQNIKETLVGGEGIKEIEERRQKFEEKHTIKHNITDEKRNEFKHMMINNNFVIKTEGKDFLAFLLFQFIPLLLLGSSCFVPGLIFLKNDFWFVILIICGGLAYFYALIRLISTLSYKIEFYTDKIRWRNVFCWNEVPKIIFQEIDAKQGYYLYFTKIGGVLRIGVEVIHLKTETNDYWVRAYPLRKKKSDDLFIYIMCWSEN